MEDEPVEGLPAIAGVQGSAHDPSRRTTRQFETLAKPRLVSQRAARLGRLRTSERLPSSLSAPRTAVQQHTAVTKQRMS